jgi:hypothetical protein
MQSSPERDDPSSSPVKTASQLGSGPLLAKLEWAASRRHAAFSTGSDRFLPLSGSRTASAETSSTDDEQEAITPDVSMASESRGSDAGKADVDVDVDPMDRQCAELLLGLTRPRRV